ncbi:kinase-like domain-containing protein [Mycotypha africana]|uniref:kinase-like domain-containing protein n=1 Tax=Mycotypha africana TaxID=64632 RepID=UPI0023015BF6|nr:kinase-like domain-containing protein [Mycotypha africana]KAI8987582.1 kinase-like domain-containing protein [Mycotypha africana]
MPPNTSIGPADTPSTLAEEESLKQLIETTPFFDVEISKDALFDGAFKVVSCVFPHWKYEDIQFFQCKDGITNQLVRVTYMPTAFSVLVRAYGKGSERLIDRKQEIINIITLASQNMCPPLYARFKNGLVYGFIKGKVSTVEELGQEKTAEWIAKKLAKWHKVKLPQTQHHPGSDKKEQQKLWATMYKWLEQVPEKYENASTQSIFETNFDMKKIRSELETLIESLETLESPIVFSHNDLLYGNIIFDEEKGTEKKTNKLKASTSVGFRITFFAHPIEEANFIDYEYGCYAFRGFDIGNHFNEFAGFECEYWRYPSKEFQLKWFDWYLTEYNNGVEPTKEEKLKLYKEVNGFALASHYYWGLWAMIQAMVSDIDFNYMEYAVLRFEEYEKRKNEVLLKNLTV